MRFIDLFAGLGGFHVALGKLGHECVFASEKNEKLAKSYKENFKMKVHGDIKKIKSSDIPEHDILCAGFPCQPFSKAGRQKGMEDEENGSLFNEIVRILKYHKPKYFILENVPNLKKHDREKTWALIKTKLHDDLGCDIKEDVLSPHEFGIPQIRKRLFIVGSNSNLGHFRFPSPKIDDRLDIRKILDKHPSDAARLTKKQVDCLGLWQEIISSIPADKKLPSFPIWSMEFGATYPYKNKTPHASTSKDLDKYRGIFGKPLKGLSKREKFNFLPSYARTRERKFPKWKQRFIKQNREFYAKYKKQLKPFLAKLKKFQPSWQKFEWNCSGEKREITNYILQFRASGIRVKRTNYAPSLVLTITQRPIIGWENRYITIKEAARLQSLESINLSAEAQETTFRALGNAVSAKVVELIASRLILEDTADKFSKEKRSEIMSKIRKTNTKPELILKEKLKGAYFRYQPKVPGNPDFAIKSKKIAIFVDGCFWHKCPKCFRPPKSNKQYWIPKIEGNVERDEKINEEYKGKGWRVIRIWEHQIKNELNEVLEMISTELNKWAKLIGHVQ